MKIILSVEEFQEIYGITKNINNESSTEIFNMVFGNISPTFKTSSYNNEITINVDPRASRALLQVIMRHSMSISYILKENISIKNAMKFKDYAMNFYEDLKRTFRLLKVK